MSTHAERRLTSPDYGQVARNKGKRGKEITLHSPSGRTKDGKPRPRKDSSMVPELSRQAQALEYKRAGWTYAMIAREMDISVVTAARHVANALEHWMRPNVEQERAEQLERCMGLLSTFYPLAREGDPYAADRVLKIMDKIDRLLGLDVQRVSVSAVTNQERGKEVVQNVAALQDALRRLAPGSIGSIGSGPIIDVGHSPSEDAS